MGEWLVLPVTQLLSWLLCPFTLPVTWSSQVSPLLLRRSLNEQAMPFRSLQLLLTKCIPPLRGFGCPGNRVHQAVERRTQDGKQAKRPSSPLRALYLRVLLACRNHNDLIGCTCFKLFMGPLSPGTITNREEKKGRKTRERKRAQRPLYSPLHFLKLWSPMTKSEQISE